MSEDVLAPYVWELVYVDGTRRRRDSPGGPWTEATVPLTGVTGLVVYGHPSGPKQLMAPVPDGPVFRARFTRTLTDPPIETRRVLIGLRYGDRARGWRFDADGHVRFYHGSLAGW